MRHENVMKRETRKYYEERETWKYYEEKRHESSIRHEKPIETQRRLIEKDSENRDSENRDSKRIHRDIQHE